MKKRIETQHVLANLYTKAKMPIDSEIGYDKELFSFLDKMDEILFGTTELRGLFSLLNIYWEKEQRRWNRFPRSIIKRIPIVKRLYPKQIKERSKIKKIR